MVPLILLQYPLYYTFLVVLSTIVFKSQIIAWFEHVLYLDEDELNPQNIGDDENQSQ